MGQHINQRKIDRNIGFNSSKRLHAGLSPNKVRQFLDAADIIRNAPANDNESLAFMSRALVQATLPHSDPGDVRAWGRQNGSFSLSIEPGYVIRNKQPVSIGLPFGTIPRLIMFWLTTEAVRTRRREICMGQSLAQFMRSVGLDPSTGGGKRSDSVRLKEQMKRLFSAQIAFTNDNDEEFSRKHYTIAEETRIWWNPKSPDQDTLFDSYILLGENFFNEITERPVPVDMRALSALKQSPLALDLYAWLTYRVSYLNKRQLVTWPQLHNQFGSDFAEIRSFRFKVRRYLARIYALYPSLRIEDERGGLVLYPSPPHVARRGASLIK